MFYTAAYAAMNVGAFAVVSHFANAGEKYVTLEDYAGLGRRSPCLAATLTFFLMSLIGIPITGGFFAKFYVFSAALQANLVGLTIIGVLNSAVGAYYYLRIIVMMYMREPRAEVPVTPLPAAAARRHCRVRVGDPLPRRLPGTRPRLRHPVRHSTGDAPTVRPVSCHPRPAPASSGRIPETRSGVLWSADCAERETSCNAAMPLRPSHRRHTLLATFDCSAHGIRL